MREHLGNYWGRARKTRLEEWTPELLEPCTTYELAALCQEFGVAHSGTKSERIERLLKVALLRIELGGWGEFEGDTARAHALADGLIPRYTRARLVEMTKQAGGYYGVNKRGLVIGLLQWREECRRRGREFVRELFAGAHRQLTLKLRFEEAS